MSAMTGVKAFDMRVCTWFLKIEPVQMVGMRVCVCVRPRLLITSGMMWHDMDLIRLVK